MEEKGKKKKLTLSVNFKKPIDKVNYYKGSNKSSVVIEKKPSRKTNYQQSNKGTSAGQKTNFVKQRPFFNKNTEMRKLAEQKATRRIKTKTLDKEVDKIKQTEKGKGFAKRREYKLTISRALNEENTDSRERSLASVRRARLKEKKTIEKNNQNLQAQKVIREVNIPDLVTIQELSNRMAEQASSLIKHLLGMGVTATINHSIDADTAEYLVKEFGHIPKRELKPDLKVKKVENQDEKYLQPRPPVITVMGHVDHGKTSLLDALRETNIVSEEHGGITQHIGAYQVVMDNNKSITFIDTPGHAAFTEMRARGSKVTDIVILVVAADDGVKPQTVEAINHAKAAKVPIVVAINKCDLPGADPQKIKNQLLEYELIAEELSGDTLFVEVSAKTKKNLDKLKETINLQAEFLDLKANPNKKATGIVLESRIDKGRGPVSTVLITNGTLKKGDPFVSGPTWGKVRAMINYQQKIVESALPSVPVEILGMHDTSYAGDDFIVTDSEMHAKEIYDYRVENVKSNKTPIITSTKELAFETSNKVTEIPIVIKSDVHGSSEALKNAIKKIKHEEVLPKIVLSDIGLISETDVSLAKASKALLIGFNVKPSKEAKKLAEIHKIEIKYFNIIYEALDFVRSALSGSLRPDIKEEVKGSAEILEIFKVSKVGKVAGSKVVDGSIAANASARLIRDGSVLYTGKINTIFREKNQTREVAAGLECGITLKDFNDFKKNDVIEAYEITKTERTI